MPQNYNYNFRPPQSLLLYRLKKSPLYLKKLASLIIKETSCSSRKWERSVSAWSLSPSGIIKIKKFGEGWKTRFKRTWLSLTELELGTVLRRLEKWHRAEGLLGKPILFILSLKNLHNNKAGPPSFTTSIMIENQVVFFFTRAGVVFLKLLSLFTFLLSTWGLPRLRAMNFPSATFSPN